MSLYTVFIEEKYKYESRLIGMDIGEIYVLVSRSIILSGLRGKYAKFHLDEVTDGGIHEHFDGTPI